MEGLNPRKFLDVARCSPFREFLNREGATCCQGVFEVKISSIRPLPNIAELCSAHLRRRRTYYAWAMVGAFAKQDAEQNGAACARTNLKPLRVQAATGGFRTQRRSAYGCFVAGCVVALMHSDTLGAVVSRGFF
jgi:hypothetical protein